MKKVILSSIKYIIFFAIGVLIFWLIYRNIEMKELAKAVREINYFWIVLSIIFGILSNISRALRWKMLIKPMGYNPRLSNTFMSVYVLYFVNLIVPRAGEVARCTVISRTDKIPFTKLVGTVFVERLADFIMLLILSIIIFAMNISTIAEFFAQRPLILEKAQRMVSFRNLIFLVILIIAIVFLLRYIRYRFKKYHKKGKLAEIKEHFIMGIKSIIHMENKWLFIGHTAFIFFMWLMMLYVIFFSYQPTANLTIRDAMVTFLMGGLAMLAPIQGGIGPWHFMVSETLLIYNVPIKKGIIFALIAHTSSNLVPYILFGGIALIILVARTGRLKKAELKAIEETPIL
jgi:glycosyltransferase 2 family protein